MAAFEVIALDTATPQLRAPGASDTYTFPRAVEMPLGTADGVLYLDGSKVVTSGSVLTFDGAILGVNGVSVGRGAGAVGTNTAVGASALAANTTGNRNTAVGYLALNPNTTGAENTAVGYGALDANSTGNENNAFGTDALGANTTGISNSAFGSAALRANTTASDNTGLGYATLLVNTTGAYNTAVGSRALFTNTTASNNTAVGYRAGYSNQVGTYNTFIGYEAGRDSAFSGNGGNTCVGASAGALLTNGTYNTFIGPQGQVNNGAGGVITTGSKNTILGAYNGNQGGLDIRTLSNRIVLSDGDGNPRWYIDNVGAAGYGPTTGGAVTQATSRTTGVTLDTPTGAITLVSAAGTTTWQTFTVTNSSVAATDTLIVNQKSGTDLYEIHVTAVAAGSFNISFKTTGGTTTEQPVFNYALIKGQTS